MNNLTNSTIQPAPFDYLFYGLTIFDNVIKGVCYVITLFYIGVLIFSKSLHKRSFMFLNHAAISNIFYQTVMLAFDFSSHPNVGNENINNILCSISELMWIFGSFIRAYSMLLLAIYRYLATFHVNVFKRINQSMFCLSSMLASIYALSFLIPVIGKYAFSTTNSYVYCLDGSSPYLINAILYLIYAYIFLIIIPVPTVIYIYACIMKKLKMLSSKVSQGQGSSVPIERFSSANTQNAPHSHSRSQIQENQSISGTFRSQKSLNDSNRANDSYDKQKTFAYQLITMCVSLCASSLVFVIFQLRGLPNYFTVFYYYRPVLRAYLLIAMSMVPVTCLYYHPAKRRLLRKIRSSYQSKPSGSII